MIDITDQNYEETVQNYDLVLLDFYAEWCGPCKAITPILAQVEEAAQGRGQKMVVGKIDTGVEVDLTLKFKVSALPTLLIIKNGEEVHRHLGMVSVSELSKVVDDFVDVEEEVPPGRQIFNERKNDEEIE